MTLPPDRGHVRTEHVHPKSTDLDRLLAPQIVRLMTEDHEAVLHAVHAAADELGAFVEQLVPRMRAGGRLVYGGAGTSGRLGVLDASECPPTFQSDPSQVVGRRMPEQRHLLSFSLRAQCGLKLAEAASLSNWHWHGD